MKKQPEPLTEELTKQGKPRQRAAGAGRPVAGRPVRLSLVSELCKKQLQEIAKDTPCTQAEAIERAVADLHRKLEVKKLAAQISQEIGLSP